MSTQHGSSAYRASLGLPMGEPECYMWQAIQSDHVPLIHQEHEAVADLMDHLRERGRILTGRPRVQVHHGRDAILVLTYRTRAAADDSTKRPEAPVITHPRLISELSAGMVSALSIGREVAA